jgi:hypothetical protein
MFDRRTVSYLKEQFFKSWMMDVLHWKQPVVNNKSFARVCTINMSYLFI